MLPVRERSLDTLAYLVTRRTLAFTIIAAVLLCVSLQASPGDKATWWSEGSTYGFANSGFTFISLLQADLYRVGYSLPAPVNTQDTPAGRGLAPGSTTGGAALVFDSYTSFWVGQGVRLLSRATAAIAPRRPLTFPRTRPHSFTLFPTASAATLWKSPQRRCGAAPSAA
jgi:hypothetical protein